MTVDFSGFRRLELNARYSQRADLVLQGKPSYWASTGKFFVYWQSSLRRWAICGKQALDAARQGCPGCACQLDPVHFLHPSRWVEYADGAWASVPVEVAAVAAAAAPDWAADEASAAPARLGAPGPAPRSLAASVLRPAAERARPAAGGGGGG